MGLCEVREREIAAADILGFNCRWLEGWTSRVVAGDILVAARDDGAQTDLIWIGSHGFDLGLFGWGGRVPWRSERGGGFMVIWRGGLHMVAARGGSQQVDLIRIILDRVDLRMVLFVWGCWVIMERRGWQWIYHGGSAIPARWCCWSSGGCGRDEPGLAGDPRSPYDLGHNLGLGPLVGPGLGC